MIVCDVCGTEVGSEPCPEATCPSIENDGHHDFAVSLRTNDHGWANKCRYCPAVVTSED